MTGHTPHPAHTHGTATDPRTTAGTSAGTSASSRPTKLVTFRPAPTRRDLVRASPTTGATPAPPPRPTCPPHPVFRTSAQNTPLPASDSKAPTRTLTRSPPESRHHRTTAPTRSSLQSPPARWLPVSSATASRKPSSTSPSAPLKQPLMVTSSQLGCAWTLQMPDGQGCRPKPTGYPINRDPPPDPRPPHRSTHTPDPTAQPSRPKRRAANPRPGEPSPSAGCGVQAQPLRA